MYEAHAVVEIYSLKTSKTLQTVVLDREYVKGHNLSQIKKDYALFWKSRLLKTKTDQKERGIRIKSLSLTRRVGNGVDDLSSRRRFLSFESNPAT